MSRKAYTVEERAEIRESMVDRAARTFSEKGIMGTNLEDVYVPQNISKTFFYSFFPSKTSLVLAVYAKQSAEILEMVRGNVKSLGQVEGLRESLRDLISGSWYLASFDDQVYIKGMMTEQEFAGFKSDRIVLMAQVLDLVGVPVTRLDPRVFYNMVSTVIWTARSEEHPVPFLYAEAGRATADILLDRTVEYVSGLRVGAEGRREGDTMDRDAIRRIEMELFQGDGGEAVSKAASAIFSMDMDDDDEAAAAADLMSKAMGTDAGLRMVMELRDGGFDFGVRFPDGETVTTLYATRGRSDPEVFRVMVEAGADPFSCNRSGSNALHILANLDPNNFLRDREAQTAEIARIPGDVARWMECNAYGATPLHVAAMKRHPLLVEALLDMGADPDATGSSVRSGYGHAVDFDGITALDVAALMGDEAVVNLLLDRGADPLRADNSGRTPAHYAVTRPPESLSREWDSIRGMEDLVARKRAILSRVGGLDAVDDAGMTPLMITLTKYRYQNGGLSEVLVELGADPNLAANDGTTPLMAACSNGFPGAVKALVAAGADLDAVDGHGRTALHHAIAWRDEKSARLLLKKGARHDIPDESGTTAGEMAASAGIESVMELMVRGG